MFNFFSKHKRLNKAAHELFFIIMEHSRKTTFFTDLAVEDSLDGRFDLMVVHMMLLIEKIDQHHKEDRSKELKRNLQEIMFDNLDLTLREMGVGDMGVGKKVKVMAEAYYGREKAYHAALSANDNSGLSEALSRNLYRGKDVDDEKLSKMTNYVFSQYRYIENQNIENIYKGKLTLQDV